MTLAFHALWILTTVGTVVFATLAAPTWRARAAAALAFLAATAAGAWIGPPPTGATSLLVAGAAATLLLRPGLRFVSPLIAGALAGFWGIMLGAQEVPPGLAIPAAAGFVPGYTAPAWPYGSVAPAAQEAEGTTPTVFLPLTAR